MSQERSSPKRWLMLAVKLSIAVAILWWVHETISDGWAELTRRDEGQWDWQPGWLIVAGGVYLLGLAPFGFFWFRVLKDLGQEPRLGETLRAYYIGHLGKYVPGKAMVVVMRAGLIRSHRVDTGIAAASVFFETLTMMAVGAFAAGTYLALSFHQREELIWSCAAGILMVVSVTPTLPPVFKRLVRLAKVGKSDPNVARKLEELGYKVLIIGWMLSLLGWVLMALSLWATLRAMGIEGLDPIGHLPRYVAGVALAVVAGFLLLILPGGVGVREAFLAKLMLPYLIQLGQEGANSTAWAAAFLLRLVWTLSELLISVMLYLGGARAPESLPPDG